MRNDPHHITLYVLQVLSGIFQVFFVDLNGSSGKMFFGGFFSCYFSAFWVVLVFWGLSCWGLVSVFLLLFCWAGSPLCCLLHLACSLP